MPNIKLNPYKDNEYLRVFKLYLFSIPEAQSPQERLISKLEGLLKSEPKNFFTGLEEVDTNGISAKLLAKLFAGKNLCDWLSNTYKKHNRNFDTFQTALEKNIYAQLKNLPHDKKRNGLLRIINENKPGVTALYQSDTPEYVYVFNEQTRKYEKTPIKTVTKKLGLQEFFSGIMINTAFLSLYCFEIFPVSQEQGSEQFMGLRHLGNALGWNCFALTDIPRDTFIGVYQGKLISSTDMEVANNPYLVKVNEYFCICASRIGGLMSRCAHLPKDYELGKNYNFFLPFVKEHVATENIEDRSEDISNRFYTKKSLQKGMIIGFSYNEKTHLAILGITPHLFDAFGNVIPRCFYSRDLLFKHPHHEGKNCCIVAPENLVEEYKTGKSETIEKIAQQIGIDASSIKAALIDQGYIPTQPATSKYPDDLSRELRDAAAQGDFNKVSFLLEWDEKNRDQLQNNIDAAGPTSGNSALHQAAANGHTWIALYLLTLGSDPNLTNNMGKTATQLARENHHPRCVDVIQKFSQITPSFTIPSDSPLTRLTPLNDIRNRNLLDETPFIPSNEDPDDQKSKNNKKCCRPCLVL